MPNKTKKRASYVKRKYNREVIHESNIRKAHSKKINSRISKLNDSIETRNEVDLIKCICNFEFAFNLGSCPKCGENTMSIIRSQAKNSF